jgi:hypothetical protein
MTPIALFDLTARLRRQFRRVLDVLALCDEAERLSKENRAVSDAIMEAASPRRVARAPVTDDMVTRNRTVTSTAKRDRAAYMRAYRARQHQ